MENPIADPADSPRADAENPSTGAASKVAERDLADFSEFEKNPLPAWRQVAADIDANPIKNAVSTVATLLALFLPDVRDWKLGKEVDPVCEGILSVVFVFFVLEISTQFAGRRAYYTSLFCWLDIAATLSLIPEVPGLRDVMSGDTSQLTLARAGRAARAGARAGRLSGLLRIAKVVRMLKIMQLFEAAGMKNKPEPKEEPKAKEEIVPEVLQRKVTEGVSRIQIIVVISAVVAASVLAFQPETQFEAQFLEFMDAAAGSSGNVTAACNIPDAASNDTDRVGNFSLDCQTKPLKLMPPNLIYLKVRGVELHKSEDYIADTIRDSDKAPYIMNGDLPEIYQSQAEFDDRGPVRAAAELRVYLTFCIVIILVLSGFIMSTEVNNLLSVPMQRLKKSQEISNALLAIFMTNKDPLPTLRNSAMKILDAEVVNIYFFDEADNILWCTHTPEDDSPYQEDIRIPVGVGLVGGCALSMEAHHFEYEMEAQLPSDDDSLRSTVPAQGARKEQAWRAKHVVCLPLVQHIGSKDVIVGVMQAINKEEQNKAAISIVDNIMSMAGCRKEQTGFTDFDVDMLQLLGDQVSQVKQKEILLCASLRLI